MTESRRLDRMGAALRTHRVVIVASVLFVLLAGEIGRFAPPWRIPASVLSIWIVLRASGLGWSDIGIRRPKNWITTIAVGVGIAVALEATAFLFLLPALQWFEIPLPDVSAFESIRGNVPALFTFLGVAWTTAAFGEEIIWRGFVLGRVARVFGGGSAAWAFSLLLTSLLFGLLHLYQGTAGVVLAGFAGLINGILYLAVGRNLWAPIIAHGMTDTLSFLLLYTGLWERWI